MYIYILVCICMCMYTYMYMYIYVYVYVYVNIYIYMYIYMYIRKYVYCIYMYICIHVCLVFSTIIIVNIYQNRNTLHSSTTQTLTKRQIVLLIQKPPISTQKTPHFKLASSTVCLGLQTLANVISCCSVSHYVVMSIHW